MISPPSISIPPIPAAPATPMPMMPAQGTKPSQSSTTMTPTILSALKPPSSQQLGASTLLGQ